MFISRFSLRRIFSVSERIAYAEIEMEPYQAVVYNVYAPTADAPEEEHKVFMARLTDSFVRNKRQLKAVMETLTLL